MVTSIETRPKCVIMERFSVTVRNFVSEHKIPKNGALRRARPTQIHYFA